jgi:hypothetical protein
MWRNSGFLGPSADRLQRLYQELCPAGDKFLVDHSAASGLMQPENLFRLLDQYQIEATLMRTQSPATRLLDHGDGWQKILSTTSPRSMFVKPARRIPWSRRLIRRRAE